MPAANVKIGILKDGHEKCRAAVSEIEQEITAVGRMRADDGSRVSAYSALASRLDSAAAQARALGVVAAGETA